MAALSDKKWRYCLKILLAVIVIFLLIHLNVIAIEPTNKDLVTALPIQLEDELRAANLLLNSSIPKQEEYGNTTVEYLPLSVDCKKPGGIIPDHYNFCWKSKRCRTSSCKHSSIISEMVCGPMILIIGASRAATADLAQWFQTTRAVSYTADYEMTEGWCAVTQAEDSWRLKTKNDKMLMASAMQGHPLVNRLPTLLYETQEYGLQQNKGVTVLKVRTALQHMQVITTPETKYLLILRDPVDRAVSQLMHMREQRYLRDKRDSSFGAKYIHNKVSEQVGRLNECFRNHGPKPCIYLTKSKESNLDTLLLWGMYIEYIEEALKFVDRNQLLIVKMEDYHKSKTNTINAVLLFTHLRIQHPENIQHFKDSRLNNITTGHVKPWKMTVSLLQEFYRPFNKRLVSLLGSEKWCFGVC